MLSFSKQDCEYIISQLELIEFSTGKSSRHEFTKPDGSKVNIQFRKENSAEFLILEEGPIKDLFSFNLKESLGLKTVPSLKIMKYSQGMGMALHEDFSRYGVTPLYKSISIQLSNPLSYDGGDLVLNGKIQTKKQGSVVVFNPTQEHGVTPITRGVRYAGILFLKESDFINTKSII